MPKKHKNKDSKHSKSDKESKHSKSEKDSKHSKSDKDHHHHHKGNSSKHHHSTGSPLSSISDKHHRHDESKRSQPPPSTSTHTHPPSSPTPVAGTTTDDPFTTQTPLLPYEPEPQGIVGNTKKLLLLIFIGVALIAIVGVIAWLAWKGASGSVPILPPPAICPTLKLPDNMTDANQVGLFCKECRLTSGYQPGRDVCAPLCCGKYFDAINATNDYTSCKNACLI